MLYALQTLQRSMLQPVSLFARTSAEVLHAAQELIPLPLPGLRIAEASWALLHRVTHTYKKPEFGIRSVVAEGHEVAVSEEVVSRTPFCKLVAFRRAANTHVTQPALDAQPRVLIVAPLSGHFATLLRDTVATMLQHHNVYITDWVDAREIPIEYGVFGLDDYVLHVQQFLRKLTTQTVHVMAVCQPTVPCLAAVSLMASRGELTPRSLILMGGPVDARKSPTAVNKLATGHDIRWFERNLLHTVSWPHEGHGRRVYPGFLQLSAFVSMNPKHHAKSYARYFIDRARYNTERAQSHERFYDDYNAVLDMDAAYYLDTVRVVFQEFALAQHTWRVRGEAVCPEDIAATAILTIEGADDDISGAGQTHAALELCPGVASEMKSQHTAQACGHYGIFSGSKWRGDIAPMVRNFIAKFDG
jgi:poly(3-hydroxybutyrate) depolymerase